MKDLIAALEAATEWSSELDRRIYKVVFRDRQSPFEERRLTTDMEYVPSYTNGLDAALTLVPKCPGSNKAGFLQAAMYQMCIGDITDARLALVVCIAALRARQAMEGS